MDITLDQHIAAITLIGSPFLMVFAVVATNMVIDYLNSLPITRPFNKE